MTWLSDTGTRYKVDSGLHIGDIPSYGEEVPAKPEDDHYTYAFSRWDPSITPISSDATYKAVFTKTPKKFTITFLDSDGTTLKTIQADYGSIPSYGEANPTKESTASETYTFDKWEPAITKVNGDATYTAHYTSSPTTYVVTWKDDEGNVLHTDTDLTYQAMPSFSDVPKKTSEEEGYDLVFDHWEPAVKPVTENTTYVAKYRSVKRQYTITWLNEDGSLIDTSTVDHGDTPTHDDPSKADQGAYRYDFAGWEPQIKIATQDATYQATFDSSQIKFTITWKDDAGNVLKIDELVSEGTIPSYGNTVPSKAADENNTYEFQGWDPEIQAVSGNATYTAVFSSTPIPTYTITWKNYDGTTLKTEEVKKGKIPQYSGQTPAKPKDSTCIYTFAGWDKTVVAASEDATYTASYKATSIQYFTITWVNDDGTKLASSTVAEGTVPQYSGATPTKASDSTYTYTFKGWDKTVVAANANTTYKATYTATMIPGSNLFPDTVYFTNNYNWSDVYAYLWKGSGASATPKVKWPGTAMTYFKLNPQGQKVYKVTGCSSYEHIIFTNNSGAQTVDIDAINLGKTNNAYYISGGSGKELTVGTWYESGELVANYNFATKGQNILHCLDWKLSTIKDNLDAIAAQGFNAIQTSPLQPVKDYGDSYDDTHATWWRFYQPIGLSIGNQTTNILFSTDDGAAELAALTEEAAKRGIRIIADVIVNHLAADDDGGTKYLYSQVKDFEPDIYNNQNTTLHNPGSYVKIDWNDPYLNAYKITQSDAFGKDLNTANSIVQGRVLSFLKSLIDCGVTGLRFDAAKHIETKNDSNCGSNFWEKTLAAAMSYAQSQYKRTVWTYGENINPGDGGRNPWSYINNASFYATTAMPGWYDLKAENCVYWGESHDDYLGDAHHTTNTGQDSINGTYANLAKNNKDLNMLYFVRPVLTDKIRGGGVGYHADWGWQNGDVKIANAR